MFKDSATQVSTLAPIKECFSDSRSTVESNADVLFTQECIFLLFYQTKGKEGEEVNGLLRD